MRRAAFLLVLAAALLLAGCEDFDPYATAPLAAPAGAKEAGPRVAICYNAIWTSQAKVTALAQEQCAAERVAKPVVTDWHVQTCPLLLPARANFVCTPKA